MGRKGTKRPCARTGCRAWAERGELFCRSHRATPRPAPTPRAEPEPALTAQLGIYASALTEEERRLFKRMAGAANARQGHSAQADLEPEIWLLRVMSRRLFLALGQDDVDQDTLRKLATVLYQGIARLAQLLRTRRALSGEAVDGLAGALAQAIDEMDSLKE